MKNLCSVCKGLDLSKINNRKPQSYSLGLWQEVKDRSSDCPFCYLVIRSSPGRRVWDQPATVEWKQGGGFYTNSLTEYIAFINPDTTKSPLGSARQLKPQVDMALVKRWINLCEKSHQNTCASKPGPLLTPDNTSGLTVFRVIDVVDSCIVDAEPDMRYIALSYVWGKGFVPGITLVRENVADLYKPGAFHRNEAKLPFTIKEAMQLVGKIGERYLWTDSLCLIQNDTKDLIYGISRMDMVYQCALLTLVVAHGVDANAGLPGLNSNSLVIPRIDDQLKVEVLPGVQMTITKGVYDGFMGTVYRKRGWTMQELVLSYRTLVFTNDMVFFCCRKNTWSEDTTFDKFPSVVNTIQGPDTGNGIVFLADHLDNPLAAYGSQLGNYATRELSNPSDAINAFTGMLRQLAIQSKSGLLHGLLTVFFDICLLFSDVAALPVPRASSLPVYARRPGFASWSWAGWSGGKHTGRKWFKDPDDVNRWLRTMTYIVWYVRTPEAPQLKLVWDLASETEHGKLDKRLVGYRPTANNPYGRAPNPEVDNLQTKPDETDRNKLNTIYRELRQRDCPLLHFFAHVVYAPKLDDPEPDAPMWPKSQVHKVIGTDGVRCGAISVDDRALLKGVQGPFELILLSKVDDYGDFFYKTEVVTKKEMYWAMLIVWVGKEKIIAERRGIGFLYFDSIKCMTTGRKHWKEIILA